MITTVALDEVLVSKAQAYTGLEEKSALLREALTALIEREAARSLSNRGGSDPSMKPIPRTRSSL